MDAPRDGGRFMMLARKVNELIVKAGVTDLILESVHVGGGTATALPLFGYRAAALMAAEARGLPAPKMVAPATWRKTVLGHGGLKRAAAKAATIEKMRWMGFEPRNEDEADALALWHYRCSTLSPDHFALGMRRASFGSHGDSEEDRDETSTQGNAPLATESPPAPRSRRRS